MEDLEKRQDIFILACNIGVFWAKMDQIYQWLFDG